MAFYGRFGSSGEFLELLRNPTPVPTDAVLLTKTELFVLLAPDALELRRVGTDRFVEVSRTGPLPEVVDRPQHPLRGKVKQALEWYRLTEKIAQEFIEQRLAIQMGSTVITSTRLPLAFGLRLLEFRERIRRFLAKPVTDADQVPVPPDD